MNELAHYLSNTYGYKYNKSAEYTALDYRDRLKINGMIMMILEMEN
jgi:hypothetical protein